MALDVLRLQNPWVKGVTGALENLAEHKLKQIGRQNIGSALEKLGYNKELALLPEPLMQAEINNINANRRQSEKLALQSQKQNQQQAQQRQYAQALESLLGGGSQGQASQEYTGQSSPQQSTLGATSSALNMPEEMMGAQPQQQQQQSVKGNNTPYLPPELTEQQATNLVKIAQKQQQLSQASNTETRKYLEPLAERKEKLEDSKRNNQLLIKLAEKGDLRAGNVHALLDKLGLTGFNQNLDTQLAEKIGASMALESAGAFGKNSRITNFFESIFQKQLPSLWNTPEGIIAIAGTKVAESDMRLKKIEIQEKIIKENGGTVPWDIDMTAEKRLKPYRDKLEKETIQAMARPLLPKLKDIPEDKRGKKIRYGDNVFELRNGKWYLVE